MASIVRSYSIAIAERSSERSASLGGEGAVRGLSVGLDELTSDSHAYTEGPVHLRIEKKLEKR